MSSTSSGELSCEIIPCAPKIRNINTGEIINGCSSDKCLVPSDVKKQFFNSVNWNKLKDNIFTYMNLFILHLMDVKDIMDQLDLLYGSNELIQELYDSDSTHFCDDISVFFKVKREEDAIPLFHISLHSLIPKYTKISHYNACTYYQKGASSNMGLFHYKIDTIDGTALSRKNNPYKAFTFAINPTIRFAFNTNSYRFDNLDSSYHSRTYNLELRNKVDELHNLLYNRFVNYWNYFILPEILIPTTGGRKTRKYKNKKRKYRRSTRKTL